MVTKKFLDPKSDEDDQWGEHKYDSRFWQVLVKIFAKFRAGDKGGTMTRKHDQEDFSVSLLVVEGDWL